MDPEKLNAVSHIVSAIIAKGFEGDTDGVDLRFESHGVLLVDGEGRSMSLRSLVHHVKSCLE